MAYDNLNVQDLLSVTNGTLCANDTPMVIITIRPKLPQSFRPHSICISR